MLKCEKCGSRYVTVGEAGADGQRRIACRLCSRYWYIAASGEKLKNDAAYLADRYTAGGAILDMTSETTESDARFEAMTAALYRLMHAGHREGVSFDTALVFARDQFRDDKELLGNTPSA